MNSHVRRPPAPDMVDLPWGVRVALRKIAADLDDMPRECAIDRAELLLWKRRIVRRLQGLEHTKVPADRSGWTTTTPRPVAAQTAPPSAMAARDTAEAVFGKKTSPGAAERGRNNRRTITSRKGKAVSVEIRQLSFWSSA